MILDLSAAVDVYSDWIDACDAVAQEAAGNAREDSGPQSYNDLVSGAGGRRNSDMLIDKHLVAAVEEDDELQGDYDDDGLE